MVFTVMRRNSADKQWKLVLQKVKIFIENDCKAQNIFANKIRIAFIKNPHPLFIKGIWVAGIVAFFIPAGKHTVLFFQYYIHIVARYLREYNLNLKEQTSGRYGRRTFYVCVQDKICR